MQKPLFLGFHQYLISNIDKFIIIDQNYLTIKCMKNNCSWYSSVSCKRVIIKKKKKIARFRRHFTAYWRNSNVNNNPSEFTWFKRNKKTSKLFETNGFFLFDEFTWIIIQYLFICASLYSFLLFFFFYYIVYIIMVYLKRANLSDDHKIFSIVASSKSLNSLLEFYYFYFYLVNFKEESRRITQH